MSRTNTRWLLPALLAGALGTEGCAQVNAMQKANDDAKTKGQYKVRLTTDSESVVGTCKFVMAISGDFNPIGPVSEASLPSYFRQEAVLHGADTVVVRGRLGEAYICGPGPLNPDGTLQDAYGPGPTPAAN